MADDDDTTTPRGAPPPLPASVPPGPPGGPPSDAVSSAVGGRKVARLRREIPEIAEDFPATVAALWWPHQRKAAALRLALDAKQGRITGPKLYAVLGALNAASAAEQAGDMLQELESLRDQIEALLAQGGGR